MDQVNRPPFRNQIVFGIAEAAFVGVVIVIVFGALNFFNIIPLWSLYPQLRWLPHISETKDTTPQQTVTPQVSPTTTQETTASANPLIAVAQSLGYSIIAIDPGDTTGRSAFYDENRGAEGIPGIGQIQEGIGGTTYTAAMTGEYVDFERIPEKTDFYMLLKDPKTDQPFPTVRVTTTQSGVSTYFFIDDLNTKNAGPFDEVSAPFGQLDQFADKKVLPTLQQGDAVAVKLRITGSVTKENEKDERGAFVASHLFIRRFGGLEQVRKELTGGQ